MLGLIRRNGIDLRYLHRALGFSLAQLSLAPLRALEQRRYGAEIDATEIRQDPIFVLGHWRTGTTHLHNLLCRDRRFGYVSVLQSIAPEMLLVGERLLRPGFARMLPKKRPFDDVALSLDAPQEEEFALLAMSQHSFYHGYFFFPRQAEEYFRRAVLFEDAEVRADWKRNYLRLLRLATHRAGGRQLVLKSPPNTARVAMLLELFPRARFVHIHRDPLTVMVSTNHMRWSMFGVQGLQRLARAEMEEQNLRFYDSIMRRYLAEVAAVPSGQLCEVSFDALCQRPLEELARVYRELSLPAFAEAEPAMRAELDARADYQKNRFAPDPALAERVRERLAFAYTHWGYA